MSALGTVASSYSTDSGLWERDIDTEGFPDGISTVKATAVAEDSTVYTSTPVSFETKNTPPNPVITEPSDHEYVTGSSVSIKVNTSEKVNEVKYRIDDQAWSSMYAGPPTWEVQWDSETVSDGLHDVTIEAKDEAGLTGQSSTKVYVDNSDPTLDIVSPVDNETIEGKYKFQALAEDTVKVDRVNITVFGSTTSMIYNEVTGYYERTIRTSTFSDGNYTASMAARDKVGHTTENRSVNFQVANTPPSMTIHSPKSGEILNGTHTLRAEVESDFLETVEYRVNDGGWEDMEYNASLENYTAEWDTTAVPDGPHSLTFKAVDEVGHVTEVTREIEVDNNPPTGSVIEPLEGEFIRDKYTFKISARDAVGVSSVGINVFNGTYPGSYNEVTGYYEYSLNTESIEDGNYSMNATVEDEAGWTYTTQDVKFKVDNSAPGVSIERPRPNIYVNDTVEINATITDRFIQDADYRIDEGSWNEMDINGDHATVLWETANFTEGSHRIDVRAADKAGHSTIDSVEVIVDNKAPTGAIASPYSGEYVKDAFTFQVSASDENGINEVRVDVFGQSYSTEYNTGTGLYEITLITSSMEDGTYDISAEIEDNAGWRTHLKNVTFHVNNEGPTLSILEPEPGMILSGVTEVRVNATDDFLSLVRYRIDNSEWRSMESTNQVWTRELDTENHTDGEHRLQVEAIDDAGLTASQSIRIKFDNTRPEGSIIAPSDGDFVGGRLALQVTAEDAVGIRDVMVNFEQVEGENASDIHQLGTRETFYDQATGYYIFEVASFRYTDGLARFNATVIDEAGFRTKLSTVEFYIDNNEPEVNYENLGQGDFVSGEVNLTVEVNDGPYVPKVDYRIDNRTWNSMDREGSVWTSLWDTTGVGDGTHTITVRARDDAGHTTRNKIDVTVDNHAPQIDILNPVPDQFVEEDVSVQIRATDEVGIETVMVDMNALVGEKPSADNWSLEATLNPSTGYYEATLDTTLIGSDGYWNVTAEAMDTSGKNTMTRTIEFRVVNHDPDLTIHSPRHGDYISSEVDINVTVDHPFTTWAYYSIDDEGWNGVNESWKTSQYSDGEHNLAIKGETVSGNQVIRNIKVIVDNNDPTISVISPVEGQFVEDWVQFRVKAKDQVGIDEVEGEIFNSTKELSYDSENGYHVFEIDTRNFDDGNYTFNATVVDLIGNTDKTETITFQVDNNAPVVDIESPQNGEYVRDTIELNVTVEDEFINEVRYSVDDTGFVPISAELNTTRLSDGEHTITVKATDKAGHTTDRKVSVIVDNIAPAIRLHTPRREEVIRGSEEIKAYVDSEVQDVTIEFPGVGLGPLAMEKTSEDNVYGYVLNTTELTGREGSGTFMARVSVQDVAGHNMTKDFQITIDNAGPQIEMIEPVKNLRNKTTVKGTTVFTLNVSSLAGAEDVQINIDGRGWNNMMLVKNNTYMYQWETEGEEDGEYTYVIRTEDKAGNVNQYSGTMKVDNPTDYWGIFQENLPGITFLLIIILLIFLLYLGRNEVRDRMKREEEEPDEGEEDEESSEKSSGWISSPFKSKEDKDKGKDKEKHLQKVKKKKEAEEKERKQEEEGTESQDEELEADKIDQPIDELDLDDKIVARLESEGIVTIEDLTEISGVELTEIDGIGQKRAAKIGKRLNEAGFSLKAAEKEEGKGLMESVMDAEVPSQKDE
ncbi:MAG: hypothetical protein KGY76_05335 [Candidatus Thermoplasmatota archaeon]|nr:hypothetical protein [Candidatus Thermoplasmatota archaeon]